MKILRALVLAGLALLAPAAARADQILSAPPRVNSAGVLCFPNGPCVGTWISGAFTSTPAKVLAAGTGGFGGAVTAPSFIFGGINASLGSTAGSTFFSDGTNAAVRASATGGGIYLQGMGGSPTLASFTPTAINLNQRPKWLGYTPWDSNNFDPTLLAPKASPVITGSVTAPAVQYQYTTIAALPACTVSLIGQTRYLFDTAAAQPKVYGGPVTGGGSNLAIGIVGCHGDAWYWD